jgi:hypothetical protein
MKHWESIKEKDFPTKRVIMNFSKEKKITLQVPGLTTATTCGR